MPRLDRTKWKYPILGGLGTVVVVGGGYALTRSGGKKKPDIPHQTTDKKENKPSEKQPQPSKPKDPPTGSVSASTGTNYQSDALGTILGDHLLDVKQNNDKWQNRHQQLKTKVLDSKFFKLAQDRGANAEKLKTLCEGMYTLPQNKWQENDGGKGVYNEEESRHLWKDAWDWCSLTQRKEDKPDNWPWKDRG